VSATSRRVLWGGGEVEDAENLRILTRISVGRSRSCDAPIASHLFLSLFAATGDAGCERGKRGKRSKVPYRYGKAR